MSDYRAITCPDCHGFGKYLWYSRSSSLGDNPETAWYPCASCDGTGKIVIPDPKPGMFDDWRDALKFVGCVFLAGAVVLGILLGWLLFIGK